MYAILCGTCYCCTGGLQSCLQVPNGDMLHEQRYAACSFANLLWLGAGTSGEMLGLEAHVGSATLTNCPGPTGSEDNGWSRWSLLLLRFSASWEQGWQQPPWGRRVWQWLQSPSFVGHMLGTMKPLCRAASDFREPRSDRTSDDECPSGSWALIWERFSVKPETHESQHHLKWNSWSSLLYQKQNEKRALKHHLACFKNSSLTCLAPSLLTQIVLEKAVQNPSLSVKAILHWRLSSAVLRFLLMMGKKDLLGWLMVKYFSEARSTLVRQEEGGNCHQPLRPWLGGPRVWMCFGSEGPGFYFITY